MRLTIVFLCFLFRLSAQESAAAVFDSAVVETGEAFVLHIAVKEIPDTLDLSAWDTLLPERQVVHRSGWYRNGDHWGSDLTFLAFDEGELDLPPLQVKLKNGQTTPTNPNHLTVIATPVPSTDLNDMADIKDIHRENPDWTDRIWILWALGGLLILGLLLHWISKPKKKGRSVTKISSTVYRESALQKLKQLENQQLWQKGEIKTYYAALSFIVREFIGLHIHVKALESSTEDLIRQLDTAKTGDNEKQAIVTLLKNADLAKFAKGLPEMDYHPQAIADARRFILSFQTT